MLSQPYPWSEEELADLIANPYDYPAHQRRYPWRSAEAFSVKRKRLGITLAREEALAGSVVERPKPAPPPPPATWRDFIEPMAQMRDLRARVSTGAHDKSFDFGTKDAPLAFISDYHMGSWGTDPRLIKYATDRLLQLHEKVGLRIAVLGDMVQMAIRLRSVIEVADNLIPPGMQMEMLRLWLAEVKHMIAWATWDNHAVARQEDATGHSAYADAFKEVTVYYNGIAHGTIHVGDQEYLIATSHHFRGRSRSNPLAAQMNYIRYEASDRDIVVAGDSHIPAITSYIDGGRERVVGNCGTLQLESGYAHRYFSLHTFDAMPVVLFSARKRAMTPFMSVERFEDIVCGS